MAHSRRAGHGARGARFYSKRDTWLTVLIWGTNLMLVGSGFLVLRDPEAPFWIQAMLTVLLGATAGFMHWVLYETWYGFSADHLVIHSGPFHWKVALADINRVEPSRNPFSAPALSLDRLAVRYGTGKRYTLISPLNKTGFLQALVSHAPQLRMDGKQAVRRADGGSR